MDPGMPSELTGGQRTACMVMLHDYVAVRIPFLEDAHESHELSRVLMREHQVHDDASTLTCACGPHAKPTSAHRSGAWRPRMP
jgi:hypothetical protein